MSPQVRKVQSKKSLTKVLVAALWGVLTTIIVCIPAATNAADAGSGSGTGLSSGMINISSGQTARLSVGTAAIRTTLPGSFLLNGANDFVLTGPPFNPL
jgi:hypothetical protein